MGIPVLGRQEKHFCKLFLFIGLRFSSWDRSGSAAYTGLEKSHDTSMGVTYNMNFMLFLSRHGHYHVRRKGNTWRKRYCSSSGPTALSLLSIRYVEPGGTSCTYG